MTKTTNDYLAPVLAWLKAGAPHTPAIPLSFNMDTFLSDTHTDCGTACCIAGAVARFNDLKIESDAAVTQCHEVGEIIGLTDDQTYALFFAGIRRNYDLEEIPPSVAAEVLERFMTTGEISWPEELPE